MGPESGKLLVKTYREGVAAKVGHDLVIEVTRWEASLDGDQVTFTADPRSLEVREGVRGVKPLTDKDRADIRKTIDDKVLGGKPIEFRGTATRDAGRLVVDGQLTMNGATRPLRAELAAGDRFTGAVSLRQTDWGIKPYRGLMGALKVRDDVEVLLDAPAA